MKVWIVRLFTCKNLIVKRPLCAQGPEKHRSLFEAFSHLREGDVPESVSTIGGSIGQRYAAAARSGSIPPDAGSSWPRSVMHGPDKHRSLFEAFASLKDDNDAGSCQ